MTAERPDFPKEIGSHEGRELDLMLAGTKPLAMFVDVVPSSYEWPDAAFEPHIAAGRLVKREFPTDRPNGHTVRNLFYALPGDAWRIEEAFVLSLKRFDRPCAEADECCARLGLLPLPGYSEHEVRVFGRWLEQAAKVAKRP